jgi:TPR repeat protein
VSRGVVYTIEGQAGELPLALATAEARTRQSYLRRRQLTLQRLRRNIGRIITGKDFDAITSLTRPEQPTEDVLALIAEMEALDGTEKSQRAFLHWYEHWREPRIAPEWRSHFRNGLEMMYGLKGTIDEAGAKKYFLDAAASGHSVARLWLAWLRVLGRCSFERDATAASTFDRQSFQEIERLAGQGDSDAAMVLGFAFADGVAHETNRSRAVAWLRQAVAAGDTVAMNCLGSLGEAGMEAESARLFRDAADRGNAVAMLNLAGCFLNGKGIKQDTEAALHWYQAAAERGHPAAMISLGNLLENGQHVPLDYPIAFQWYQKAADLGNGKAMACLGWMYLSGHGTSKDDSKAVAWFQRAVGAGDTFGMRSLGALYADGNPLPRDYGKAVDLWRRAADLSDVKSMSTLGAFYEYLNEPALAVPWYQQAAELGDAEAAYKLGLLYYNGRGIEKDLVSAAKYFSMGAERGDIGAMNDLGALYELGSGVKNDPTKAMAWYQKAVEQGSAYAMYNLGRCFSAGIGVPADASKARHWFQQAAEHGYIQSSEGHKALQPADTTSSIRKLWKKLTS